ncbi:putative pentatricopeptide repeat-containing protein At1g56570 [Macadamia integrifolia]|uniref:putative pentatricopeptide repeat-containing protein At1g56570 n=1 Tax=Macadamia integrifolia TaxID=60698 RepID=UPI001C4ECCD1|nr:putative pentatricopeptide repeat-containing protein At1g56570 [Macadamia integrifolia]XP_042490141.1 putative pentatricopeptide repeat-containing protein At1g56570 [Macadamia integrifolia]XP_042490142.1 putative pentatricopeptide repeat-containing protein At1g56570 [Macadamia integrifolia]
MNAKKLLGSSHLNLIPPIILNPFRLAHRFITFQSKGSSILATKTRLIISYCERSLLNEARQLFDEIAERDVVAWTAMITGYTSCGRHQQAWRLFRDMTRDENVEANAFTLSSVLKACKGLESCSCGAIVHGLAIKYGLDGSLYVENTLMDMYATCSVSIDEVCMVFHQIHIKNEVSWTTMISAYTHRGDGFSGLQVFRRMLQEEAELNPYSCSIAIRACAATGSYSFGKQICALVFKYGFNSNLPIGNSIIDMYCWCHSLSEANQYFLEMFQKDLTTWNTLIAGFERSGSIGCLHIFSQMVSQGLSPNCFTFTSLASACANMTVLSSGQQVHGGIIRRGFESNLALTNALLDMYAKCGNIADSFKIFSEMPQRDVVSWTSMMIGYGTHGYGKEAIGLFDQMVDSGIRPDAIVFMGVLSACSHAGLVCEGLKYFKSMVTGYGITPNQEIYGCVVDLLGRAGKVKEAYELIENMPFKPDETVWGALLGACKAYGDSNLGKLAAQKLLDLRPSCIETYVILSNIYAADGRWGEFAKTRKLIRSIGNRKEAGRSWIEVGNKVYSFVVGEKVGLHIELVYNALKILVQHMKETGYVPDSDSLLYDLEDGT